MFDGYTGYKGSNGDYSYFPPSIFVHTLFLCSAGCVIFFYTIFVINFVLRFCCVKRVGPERNNVLNVYCRLGPHSLLQINAAPSVLWFGLPNFFYKLLSPNIIISSAYYLLVIPLVIVQFNWKYNASCAILLQVTCKSAIYRM